MSAQGVQVSGLRFGWPGGPWSLSVPDWSVPAGGEAVVVGPSGSGKSTLLSLLAGERTPAAGEVWVAGRRVDQQSLAERQAWRLGTVGMVLQDHPLLDHLDVLNNVLLPYRLGPARLDAAARARAVELLGSVGLGGFEARSAAALSRGERQRVAIARALVCSPAVVLADEPTSGLDPLRTQQVVALLRRSCQAWGATLVVVTHDPAVRDRFERRLELP
jgi:putative ABC transport system ATP-binding protein